MTTELTDTLDWMAELEQYDHFTPADRKVLIESAVMLDITRKDVSDLKANGPKEIASVRTEVAVAQEKLDKRITTLENFRWWLLGAVAVLNPVLAALTAYLVSKMLHP